MAKRRSQRGFVLVAALALAILYFLLMELVLIDSSRALAEAQRFRSRTVAAALAENGAELAAQQIAAHGGTKVTTTDAQGDVTGSINWNGDQFRLDGAGTTKGVIPQSAHVMVQGQVKADATIEIDYTVHTQ